VSQPFQPRLDILPPAQRRLWNEFGATPRQFTLYGGTALALRLGHRQSEDFDFFSREPFDAGELHRTIPYLRAARIEQFQPNTLTCSVEREGLVKVSFFGDLGILGRLEEPADVKPGVWLASLPDIAATKMRVVQMRAAAKDYLDIVALLNSGMTLAQMLDGAAAVYGKAFNALVTLKALSYFGDGDLPSLPVAAQRQLSKAAGEIV
jgi:hypothetical protein